MLIPPSISSDQENGTAPDGGPGITDIPITGTFLCTIIPTGAHTAKAFATAADFMRDTIEARAVGGMEDSTAPGGTTGIIREVMGKPGIMQDGMDKAGIMQEGMGKAGIMQEGMGKAGIMQEGMGKAGIIREGMGKAGIMQEGMGKPGIIREGMGTMGGGNTFNRSIGRWANFRDTECSNGRR